MHICIYTLKKKYVYKVNNWFVQLGLQGVVPPEEGLSARGELLHGGGQNVLSRTSSGAR